MSSSKPSVPPFRHSPSAAFHAPGPPTTSAVPTSPQSSTPRPRPVLVSTVDIVQLYRRCNPSGFRYQSALNPKRVLTRPSEGVLNGGADNSNSDLILYVNDILQNHSTGHRYQIIDMLGAGTFGQVCKVRHLESGHFYAVKVVKNKPAYFNQGLTEVRILELLNQQYDPTDSCHIVRLREFFVFRKHLCLVFEMLSLNLYELIKQNQFRGLSISLVRIFVSQILKSLTVLARASVIHCDLKPENILLITPKSPQLKLIDFGSACFEKQTVYSYIQSRFYRSPEVLVGYPYKAAIDMWSLGCIGAELFLGLPLFPGTSEYNQLARIIDMIGMPPAYILDRGKSVNKFFHRHGSRDSIGFTYTLKTEEEYARETNTALHPSKKYFNYRALDDIIMHFPIKSSFTPAQQEAERTNRRYLCDFLRGVLNLDPQERWTPEVALRHPFITSNTHVSLPWRPEPVVSGTAAAAAAAAATTAAAAAATAPPATLSTVATPQVAADVQAKATNPPVAAAPSASASSSSSSSAGSSPAVAAASGSATTTLPVPAAAPSAPPTVAAAPSTTAAAPPPATAPAAAAAPPPFASLPPPQQALVQQPQHAHINKPRGSGSGIVFGSGGQSGRHQQSRGRGKHGGTRNRSQSFNLESTNAGAQTWGTTHTDPFKTPYVVAPPLVQPNQTVPAAAAVQQSQSAHSSSSSPSKNVPSPQPAGSTAANSPSRRQPPPLSVGSPPVPTPLPNSRLSGTFTAVNPNSANTSPRQQQAQQDNRRMPRRRSQNGGVSPDKDDDESSSSPGRRNSRGYEQKEINDKMAALSLTQPPSKPPSSYARAVAKSSPGHVAPVAPPLSPPRGSHPGQSTVTAATTAPLQPASGSRSHGSSSGGIIDPKHKAS